MTAQIPIPLDQIRAFCQKHCVRSLALFGSVLRDDFRPDSDVDVLVEFEPDAAVSLFDLAHMQEEFSRIVGRPVDLVERKAVEHSRNYIRRKGILEGAELVYANR